MKILHTVESYYPSVGGMPEVVKQLSERLARLGHEVTIATSFHEDRKVFCYNGVKIEQFKISGNIVNGIIGTKEEVERYKAFLNNKQFDIISNFAAQHWATDLALTLLKNISAKKVFIPTGFSTLNFPEFKKYFEDMKNWMKAYDMNIFLSNDYQDINFARNAGIKALEIIPNGASKEEFESIQHINIRKRFLIPQNHTLILNVSSHTGIKGHSETIDIFRKSKIKNATLLLLGNKMGPGSCTFSCLTKNRLWKYSLQSFLFNKKLIVADLPRQEIVAAYQQADLFLFASNLECSPIVLFECLASKTPFLTTDVGNTKEIIKWTSAGVLLPTFKTTLNKISPIYLRIMRYFYHLLIKRRNYSSFIISVAKIQESARMLKEICENKELRIKLAENGYKAWLERFTWEVITKQYETIYKKLLEEK